MTRWLVLFFGVSLSAFAAPSFSDLAWKDADRVYAAIKGHPFNRELARGTLAKEKFAYYSEQDALYLVEFAKALGLLATKLKDKNQVRTVLEFVRDCFEEGETKTPSAHEMMPGTQAYTDYLLRVAALGSAEELAAALLPCFWVYLRLADELLPLSEPGNPYADWIKMYSAPKYRTAVDKMLALTNELARRASAPVQKQMHRAFQMAMNYELKFWQASYQLEDWPHRR